MKFYGRFSLFCTLFASSVSLVSCTLSDEFDKVSSIKSVEGTGSFSANILNETWLLKDLLPTQKLNLTEGADGSYNFSFNNTSNFVLDNVTFPLISTATQNLPPLDLLNLDSGYNSTPVNKYYTAPIFPVDITIKTPEMGDTSFSSNFNIEAVKLKSGAQISMALDINTNSSVMLTVVIPNLTKDGTTPYTKTFGPMTGNVHTNLVCNDLDGYILAPSSGKISAVIVPSVKRISTPITGSMQTSFIVDIADHHEYVKGFFGEIKVPIDPIEFPFSMPADFKGTDDSHMTLKEIAVTLKLNQNGFVLPIDFDLSQGIKVYYQGNNTPQTVQTSPVTVSADGQTYTFKIQNINVLNIEKLVINPTVTANKGLTSGENMISDTASLSYDLSVTLPLDIDAKDLAFQQDGDNIFYDDKTTDEENFEILDGRILLKGAITSEIPMGASLQVYYKNNSDDETYADVLFDEPLTIKANGTSNFLTSVTKAKYDVLKKYKYQAMKVTLNGSGAILSSQKINVKVGVAVKGTIKAKL